MALVLNGNGTVTGFVGGVMQVVQAVLTGQQSSTAANGTFTDITNLTLNITPTASSNKIFLIALVHFGGDWWFLNGMGFRFMRDSTAVGIGTTGSSPFSAYNAAFMNTEVISDRCVRSTTSSFLDSPSTTSQITYKVQMKSSARTSAGSYPLKINSDNDDGRDNPISTLTAYEIGA